jgi:hypothetical protein
VGSRDGQVDVRRPEAPPDAEDRYFYFEHVEDEDWLWLGLTKAMFPHEFGETSTERLRKFYWLSRFRDNGCQLVDAVKDGTNSVIDITGYAARYVC